MTITVERPAALEAFQPAATPEPMPIVDVAALRAPGCPGGVPWCTADPDWHDDEDGSCHDSQFVILPTGTVPCTRHDEGYHPGASEVWLNIAREDVDGEVGRPHIYLAPHNAAHPHATTEEANIGLDEAEALAYELLRLVAAARGSKRARDVRPGDVVVIDGVEHTATVVLLDSDCCCDPETGEHGCGGSVPIQTDRCEDGEWAGVFDPDDLVEVRAEVDR